MMLKPIYLCLIIMSSYKVEINKVMNSKRVKCCRFCPLINLNLGMLIVNQPLSSG